MKRMKNSWWNEVQLFFTVSSDRNQILISIVQLTSFMMLFYFKMYSFFFFVLPFDSFSLKTATICPFHVYIINLISYKMHLKISHIEWRRNFLFSFDWIQFTAISKHDPEITGLVQSYAFGDYIDANCTSDQSNPPSDLTWYIDERKVSETFTQKKQFLRERNISEEIKVCWNPMNDDDVCDKLIPV